MQEHALGWLFALLDFLSLAIDSNLRVEVLRACESCPTTSRPGACERIEATKGHFEGTGHPGKYATMQSLL